MSVVLTMGSLFIVSIAIVARVAVWEFASHSGKGSPPMFGDFEAQRHWVEITNNLPLSEWYVETKNNNLTYWGMDYPPLTAYHSHLIGVIAKQVLMRMYGVADGARRWHTSFGLKTSRGSENIQTLSIMRHSALWSEVAVYFTASITFVVMIYSFRLSQIHWRHRLSLDTGVLTALGTLLLWGPISMIFVDHCHFQFNGVSLGLIVWAVNFLVMDIMASYRAKREENVFYVCLSICSLVASYCFKQMSLYYCLGFAAIYFGKCVKVAKDRERPYVSFFVSVFFCFVTGVGSMLVIFYPFIASSTHLDVLQRVFPVGRGLYEDKVANVWCCLSLVWKLPAAASLWLPSHTDEDVKKFVVIICAIATVFGSNPSAYNALAASIGDEHNNTTKRRDPFVSIAGVLWVLIGSSMSFFLFSFQVHEKSILLPVTPAVLLLAMSSISGTGAFQPGRIAWLWCFVLFSHLSLFQLAEKDKSLDIFLVFLVGPVLMMIAQSWMTRSALQKFVFFCLVVLASEEAVRHYYLESKQFKKYPHLSIMARMCVCCFVFVSTWFVAAASAYGHSLPPVKAATAEEVNANHNKVD